MSDRRLAATLWAAVAAIAMACASCSGGSSEARPISVAAAYHNPCLLITQGEAKAILGNAGQPEVQSGFKSNSCSISDRTNGTNIEIAIENQSFVPVVAEVTIQNAAPVASVGHDAVCGQSLSIEPLSAKTFELYAAIASHYSLNITGGSSCAIDVRFAEKVYSRL